MNNKCNHCFTEKNLDSENDVVNADDGNIARDEPKTDEQNPMDFAANIEKVKEVSKSIYQIYSVYLNYTINDFLNSMAGIGAPYLVRLLKKFYPMNPMEVLLYVTAPMTIIFSH